ncbi:rod shape-determining protein MreD [Micavibrio aeruginosavorus]|uniref:rod shape-determining protein MreD n=1 Tax=Micavibrio aeruginosavorus TaxID=349221 RepID=UPI001F1FE20B|nr:rod shape-determining protein MreD [Micavibrio aeruginosavorus]
MRRRRSRQISITSIDAALRLTVPYILLAVLFLLNVTALPVPYMGVVKPFLVLMPVYYWAVYRPTLMPPALCFIVGILLDMISGTALGVNAISFVLVQMVVRDQRRFLMAQPYITTWAVFSFVVGGVALLQWGLYGLVDMVWGPLMPVMVAAAMTVFLFPVITLFLILTHRLLPS